MPYFIYTEWNRVEIHARLQRVVYPWSYKLIINAPMVHSNITWVHATFRAVQKSHRCWNDSRNRQFHIRDINTVYSLEITVLRTTVCAIIRINRELAFINIDWHLIISIDQQYQLIIWFLLILILALSPISIKILSIEYQLFQVAIKHVTATQVLVSYNTKHVKRELKIKSICVSLSKELTLRINTGAQH